MRFLPALPRSSAWLLLPFGLVLLLAGCSPEAPSEDTLFKKHGPEKTGLDFVNAIEEDTSTFNLVDYYYIYNGAGVAVGDINGDDLPDVYFSGNQVDGRLYVNQGNLQFTEGTEAAGLEHGGWETGVTFADVNANGHLDLYICRAGPYPADERTNLLYLNNGDGTFRERAEAYGIADTSASTQAAFFDYDKDGDLDLFLANHSNHVSNPNDIRSLDTDGTGKGADRLYRNDGNGTFTDVTVDARIVHPGMSLGVGINDLNGDGWEDLYVTNDFMANDYLYLNNGDGTFDERGAEVLKHHSYAAMGNDLADVNNDGRVDVMVVDMWPPDNERRKRMSYPLGERSFRRALNAGYHPQYWRNTLQINNGVIVNGAPSFGEVGQYAGVEASGWSWAPLFGDFDLDGRRDLWITNGYRRAMIDLDFIDEYVHLQRQHGVEASENRIKQKANQMYAVPRANHIYRNEEGLSFENVSEEWGSTDPSFSNGGAYADLDNDGDLDLVVNNIDDPASLYENTVRDSSFLKVHLTGPEQNTRGVGAEIRVFCADRVQRRHQAVSRGYQSSVSYPVHFGLGECPVADSLRVRWPDGATQRLTDIPAGQTLRLDYEDAIPGTHPSPSMPNDVLLRPARGDTPLDHEHEEEPFRDFQRQCLLPHKHSQAGPGVAVGDVNGDGLEDVFLGGAYRHSGSLFVQQPDGSFNPSPLGEEPYYAEDMGPLFFDADSDGDLDLYVASGSNEFASGSEHLQDRLYLNDGDGSFSRTANALPDLSTSTFSVQAADYDRDGDLDLFVGGRLQPRKYPAPGRSYVLQNDGGSFSDVTRSVAPMLQDIGMVTDALWTDFNNDGWIDLIVVGEFMSIRFFQNTGGQFRDVTDETGLQYTSGWWNSIVGADFDADGDTDYVVGNLGLNTRYEASPEEPVRLYADDFDRNRHIDPILTHVVQGEEVPVVRRDRLVTQLPRMKQRFSDYESYANASITDLFSEEQLEAARTLRATRFKSSFVENLGDGEFRIRGLLPSAQLAPLYGLLPDDVDGDGHLDLLAVGNSYAPDVITGRHDALIGVVLRGDGSGTFEAVPHQKSGFFVDGDAKGLARFHRPDGVPLYIATQNDDSTRVFTSMTRGRDRTVQPRPMDAWAEIARTDTTIQRHEFRYGHGYLSQSSRRLHVPPGTREVTLYSYTGESRTVSLTSSPE